MISKHRFCILSTAGIALPIVTALILFLSSCSDGQPQVIRSNRYPNPSGEWFVTVEEVDNGLGFGAGTVYDEIHISQSGVSSFAHGDKDPTVAYYSESTFGDGHVPEVKWLANDRLRIVLDPRSHPGRQEAKVGEVSIEYLVRGWTK